MVSGRMIGSLIGAFGGRAVGGMLGGGTGRMVGSLLGSMVGSRGISGGLGSAVGGLGGLLGGGDKDEPIEIPDEQAVVLIRAMTNAAKADGEVDQEEIDNIVRRAGDLEAEDEAFLRAEFAAPLDLDAFIESVPSGMEAEVYTASILPIEIDSVAEKTYLQNLADGLGLKASQVEEIHNALEIPTL